MWLNRGLVTANLSSVQLGTRRNMSDKYLTARISRNIIQMLKGQKKKNQALIFIPCWKRFLEALLCIHKERNWEKSLLHFRQMGMQVVTSEQSELQLRMPLWYPLKPRPLLTADLHSHHSENKYKSDLWELGGQADQGFLLCWEPCSWTHPAGVKLRTTYRQKGNYIGNNKQEFSHSASRHQ